MNRGVVCSPVERTLRAPANLGRVSLHFVFKHSLTTLHCVRSGVASLGNKRDAGCRGWVGSWGEVAKPVLSQAVCTWVKSPASIGIILFFSILSGENVYKFIIMSQSLPFSLIVVDVE